MLNFEKEKEKEKLNAVGTLLPMLLKDAVEKMAVALALVREVVDETDKDLDEILAIMKRVIEAVAAMETRGGRG